jgi:hypothetical protein
MNLGLAVNFFSHSRGCANPAFLDRFQIYAQSRDVVLFTVVSGAGWGAPLWRGLRPSGPTPEKLLPWEYLGAEADLCPTRFPCKKDAALYRAVRGPVESRA